MLAEGARDWLGLGGFTGLMFQPAENREKVKAISLDKSKSRYLPAFEKVQLRMLVLHVHRKTPIPSVTS